MLYSPVYFFDNAAIVFMAFIAAPDNLFYFFKKSNCFLNFKALLS